MTKEEFVEYATKYLRLGFSIIPVGTNKKPLLKWEEYQKRKPTQEEVSNWADKYKNLNIGIVTGSISGIVAVDIEAGGSTANLPMTILSQTGGGGYHFFYKHPQKPVKNAVRIKDKTDIRGDGGYVIAPPSLHKSGNTYKWLRSPEQYQFAELPQWILITNVENDKVKIDWQKLITSETPEGTRNNTATQLVGKLLYHLPSELWEDGAWPALKEWNINQNKPPLTEQELRATFESISKRELNKASEIETPQSNNIVLINTQLSYKEVENKVKEFLPNSQTTLKLILAVAVSSTFQNPLMLWFLLVGVPSSGKTDMVRLVKDADVTYYLDNLTQNAFISGERANRSNKVHDLLPLLDKKCLIIKDWTSIFSLDEKMTKKLLGDLVGIYDKEFTKFSSRRGNISYSSAFSQLGCITPATLNRHTNYMNMVGPRFLCYTMPPTTFDAEKQSYEIIFSKDRSLIEKEARLHASSYLNQLTQQTPSIQPLSLETREYLRLAAKLMSNCRGIVLLQSATFKNEEGEDVKYYEVLDVQIEEPWRAIQQLISLSKYLAFVVSKDEVGIEELTIIKEVVISSMPADRSQALRTLKEHGGEITAKELADLSEKSTKTSRRLLDELVALKALEKIKGSGTIATDYKISEQFKDFLLLDPTEFMSRNQPSETETPHGMQLSEKEKVNEPFPY